jgi:hypothetical protein
MARLTDQSSVSNTRSAVGDNPSSSSSPPPSPFSLGALEMGTGAGAAFFPIWTSLFCAWSNNPLSSASSNSVFSDGPDRSGCFSLKLDGDCSLRLLAIVDGRAVVSRLGMAATVEQRPGGRTRRRELE